MRVALRLTRDAPSWILAALLQHPAPAWLHIPWHAVTPAGRLLSSSGTVAASLGCISAAAWTVAKKCTHSVPA
jgi:hypothetical protein